MDRKIWNPIAKAAITSALLLFSFTACDTEEFLTDEQLQSNGFAQARNSVDLENLVEGAYYAVSGNGGWRATFDAEIIYANFIGDEGAAPSEFINLRDDGIAWYGRDFSFRDHDRLRNGWNSAYSAIITATQIIDFIERNGGFNDRYGDDWTDRIKGEAHFIRAWCHMMLVRIHGGSPVTNANDPSIILRMQPPSGAFDNPPLATVGEVYDAIIQDVEAAIELLPEQFDPARDPAPYADRATKYSAHFLAARAYFALNDWQKAEENATAVINSGLYPLQDDPLDSWIHRSYNAKGSEVVFQYVQYNPGQQRWKTSVVHRYFGYTDGNGRPDRYNNGQQLYMSDHFLNTVGWSDPEQAQLDKRFNAFYVRHEAGEDPRANFAPATRALVWPNKWYRSEFEGWGTASMSSLPLMRAPEMYLTRAWIRFQNGDLGGAAADVDAVRSRAWAGEPSAYEPITAENITEEVIETERMAELALEGDRVWYLQAIQKDIPAGDRSSGPYPSNEIASPVPQAEADRNPNVN